MKVVVTSQGTDLNSQVDPRFGRAKYFLVVDTDTGESEAHDNSQNLNALQGAGVQAGKNVTDLGAQAVITGHVGPRAFAALQAGGVRIYVGASGTVQQAIEALKAGALQETSKANVEGHWA
ncbi:MAG TPA: NifB/NifX family molybdenum-iron cluster-binding protein [Phycisphaerae bacterium]|nr:NifB/NifX family molybdenum-iron cluster-binding protein [Phycisphaerae bacterium]HUT57354.1 NifB/NifX family molybdenum-iron cluster-binding protein [Phycisphaerae bacterium]